MPAPDEPTEQLPAAEEARMKRRDRKRTTPMVVDGAGLKRLQHARRDRAEARRRAGSGDAGGGQQPVP